MAQQPDKFDTASIPLPSLWRRLAATACTVLAAAAGLYFGYAVGMQIAGMWLAVIMSLNAGLFAGLLATAMVDRLLRPNRPSDTGRDNS